MNLDSRLIDSRSVEVEYRAEISGSHKKGRLVVFLVFGQISDRIPFSLMFKISKHSKSGVGMKLEPIAEHELGIDQSGGGELFDRGVGFFITVVVIIYFG